jgi:hypothetical protein
MAFPKPLTLKQEDNPMSQTKTKAKPIKVLGGYNKKSPAQNLAYANAVHSGVYSDPADYPTPPINEATFKGAIDTLSAKISAALDGGKKAIAERNHQAQVVIKMMRELGHYVETACKDDIPTFLKSGFRAASLVQVAKPPLSQSIRKITPGKNSGQLHVILIAIIAAAAYEIRYAPIVNGTPGTWTTQLVTKTRPAATITGLTPGTACSIQVRSFADATGFTDWSDPVMRITI